MILAFQKVSARPSRGFPVTRDHLLEQHALKLCHEDLRKLSL